MSGGALLIKLFAIFLAAVLIQNFVFIRFLGLCPYMGVSSSLTNSIGMGLAVIFVMTLASFFTFYIYHYVLVPLKITYLRTIFFILVIAGLVQFVEMFLQRYMPNLYDALGIYLPLITTNCAILGVTILNINSNYNLAETLTNAIGSGLGFTLAITLMAATRERLELEGIPKAFRGLPIAFITAALMSIAFMGFSGIDRALFAG